MAETEKKVNEEVTSGDMAMVGQAMNVNSRRADLYYTKLPKVDVPQQTDIENLRHGRDFEGFLEVTPEEYQRWKKAYDDSLTGDDKKREDDYDKDDVWTLVKSEKIDGHIFKLQTRRIKEKEDLIYQVIVVVNGKKEEKYEFKTMDEACKKYEEEKQELVKGVDTDNDDDAPKAKKESASYNGKIAQKDADGYVLVEEYLTETTGMNPGVVVAAGLMFMGLVPPIHYVVVNGGFSNVFNMVKKQMRNLQINKKLNDTMALVDACHDAKWLKLKLFLYQKLTNPAIPVTYGYIVNTLRSFFERNKKIFALPTEDVPKGKKAEMITGIEDKDILFILNTVFPIRKLD